LEDFPMRWISRPRGRGLLFCLMLGALASMASAQDSAPPVAAVTETVQVTATRIPEASVEVPAAVSVVSGDDLRALGAHDLASALALVGGVSIAPGGDGGPASSVPELWGLREFDAFLLVVDGVPWGGAFNPALASLDLENVDRIEVLRGSAPVMYGATSFVGVIQVLHRAAGSGGREASLGLGSHGSWNASAYLPFADVGSWRQSLAVRVESLGLEDDRAGFERGHVLYRATAAAWGGTLRLDGDATFLRQDPASPHPREGRVLTSAVPLDANHNPSDAKLDEDRFHLVGGFDRKLGAGDWSTTFAFDSVKRDIVRGFLSDISDEPGNNAAGFAQDQEETGVYFDSHWALVPREGLKLVVGVDHLYGKGKSEGENFDYHVGLDGSGAPASGSRPVEERPELEDERNFSGLYAQTEWTPAPRWRVEVGARLNATHEDREGGVEPGDSGEGGGEEEEGGSDSRSVTRGSGVLGVSYQAWRRDADEVWLFADYRDAFKPAAIDFGPEAESIEILKPETADSVEAGVKGRLCGGRVDFMISAFQMDFSNLVISDVVNDLPVLRNAGEERFKGYELEAGWRFSDSGRAQLSYAHHDSRFRDFIQVFDGVPTQLSGKRLEMAPRELAAVAAVWAPANGLQGSVVVNHVGERFLNKRNTALAASYTTLAAGIGWRADRWTVRLDGRNLTDERDPVAESELGDAQYYRLPARSLEASLSLRF
jgi:iron complex outermembrane receptor protein